MPLANVRFSIGRLMACVCGIAVVLTLARFSFMRWGSEGLSNLAILLFSFAGCVIPYFYKGRWAMFWGGFGGYGLVYLSFTLGYFNLPFRLPTSFVLDAIYDLLPANPSFTAIDFHRAGHAVFASLFGFLIGIVMAASVSTLKVEQTARPSLRALFPTVFAAWDRLPFGRRP